MHSSELGLELDAYVCNVPMNIINKIISVINNIVSPNLFGISFNVQIIDLLMILALMKPSEKLDAISI